MNPLECLSKDLKCCICLSITVEPVSLPCNHFFCEVCLQRLMKEAQDKARLVRKAKSSSEIKVSNLCPECRMEFNRRNIVEDPVVRKMAQLCAELSLQPDVRELRSKDDSIFDMSQASPLPSPYKPPPPTSTRLTRSSSSSSAASSAGLAALIANFEPVIPSIQPQQQQQSKHQLPSTAQGFSSPSTKRKLPSSLGFLSPTAPTAASPSAAPTSTLSRSSAVSSSTSASRHRSPALPAPRIPDVDDSASHEVDDAAYDTSHPSKRGRSRTSTPFGGRVPRAATLNRKSYKDPATQLDDHSLSPDKSHSMEDGDSDAETDNAPVTFTLTPLRRKPLTATTPSDSSATTASSSGYKQLKDYPPVPIPPDGCAVCGEVTEEEEVVRCRGCGVQVHLQLCYGSPIHTPTESERANWWCDRCSPRMGTKEVSCCVCPNTEDQAFKKTDKGKWIHASCANWISGPQWKDPSKRDIVYDVNKIHKDRYAVQCKFCTGKGAIIQCTYGHDGPNKCTFGYHIPCGVRFGILFEMRSPDPSSQLMSQAFEDDFEETDDVFFHSFCKKHQPLKDTVPACNSDVSQSAQRKKERERQRKKRKRGPSSKGKKGKTKTEPKTAAEEDEDDSDKSAESDADTSLNDSKRSKLSHDDDPVNRSINLADTSMDTSMDTSTSSTDTPAHVRRSDSVLFRSLFHAPPSSPFTTPIAPSASSVHGTPSANVPSPATASGFQPAARKLAFSPPPPPPPASNQTVSARIKLRSSPNDKSKESSHMLRSASEGALTSSQGSSSVANFHSSLMASSSSTRQSDKLPIMTNGFVPSSSARLSPSPTAAAATASHTHSTRSSAALHSSSTPTSTPSLRAPLRSMARDEVTSRDSNSRNSVSPSLLLPPKSRAMARRHIVLLGTKLDAEQQALLEELATLLNEVAASGKDKDDKKYAEKFVYVQHHFDESVTHVITTATESQQFILQGRTMKYFQGLLAGCWVLGVDWIAASLCARKMMPEQDYLVRGDSKLLQPDGEPIPSGAKRARNQTQLFKGLHFVWASSVASKPTTRDDVTKLIHLGGGEVAAALPDMHTSRTRSKESHESDIEEGESQLDDFPTSKESSPIRPTPRGYAHFTSAASHGYGGRWFLLVDDTSVKRSKPGNELKTLKRFVTPADWHHCVKHHIEIVGVNWLFDSISAFKIQPTEKPQATK